MAPVKRVEIQWAKPFVTARISGVLDHLKGVILWKVTWDLTIQHLESYYSPMFPNFCEEDVWILNSQNPLSQHAMEFWEMKSMHLKIAEGLFVVRPFL